MSVLINKHTRVLVQGITGKTAHFIQSRLLRMARRLWVEDAW